MKIKELPDISSKEMLIGALREGSSNARYKELIKRIRVDLYGMVVRIPNNGDLYNDNEEDENLDWREILREILDIDAGVLRLIKRCELLWGRAVVFDKEFFEMASRVAGEMIKEDSVKKSKKKVDYAVEAIEFMQFGSEECKEKRVEEINTHNRRLSRKYYTRMGYDGDLYDEFKEWLRSVFMNYPHLTYSQRVDIADNRFVMVNYEGSNADRGKLLKNLDDTLKMYGATPESVRRAVKTNKTGFNFEDELNKIPVELGMELEEQIKGKMKLMDEVAMGVEKEAEESKFYLLKTDEELDKEVKKLKERVS